MRVSIAGTGYVGLVTGACLAEQGHTVLCVDVDPARVEAINQGRPTIHERDLEPLLARNVPSRLTATTDLAGAVAGTELTLIAVGTPFRGGAIDLTDIRTVTRQIGEALRAKSGYHAVVVKSTVVPGTTEEVVAPLLAAASGKRMGADFGVGMNPEFLTEGEAVQDFLFPDRLVLGAVDARTLDVLEALYAGFPNVERIRTNPRTAEMIKYASNALLATMISFSNEIGNLCAKLGGIDVVDVLHGVHASKYLTTVLPNGERIVPPITSFLGAGCGFGGSCLPKDVNALIAHGARAGSPMPLLEAVIHTNERQPGQVLDLLAKHFPDLRGVRVGILGLAFRPGTDDVRESPAFPILRGLRARGAVVQVYDPVAMPQARRVLQDGEATFCEDLRGAVRGVDALVLVTRWEHFAELPRLLATAEQAPVLIDGRRMLDKESVPRYEGIGL